MQKLYILFQNMFGHFFPKNSIKEKNERLGFLPGTYTLVDNGVTVTRRYHIRKLSDQGPKFSGGIDTPTLCGKRESTWFDKEQALTPFGLSEACPDCREIYKEHCK